MKTGMNKLLSILLSAVLVCTLLPAFSAFAEDASEIVRSGYCGAGGSFTEVCWTLYADGLLRVYGSGDIGDFGVTDGADVTALVIEEGVTGIGKAAFSHFYDMTEVTLPHSVAKIAERAFSQCHGLLTITYAGEAADWSAVETDENWLGEYMSLPAVVFSDGSHLCGDGVYKEENYIDSTCSAQGSYDKVYSCPVCGEETRREHSMLSPEPHLWKDWTILVYPTETQEGLMERRCRRDETHTESALIPAGEFGAHEVLRGYCGAEGEGKNLIWSLSDDNVITVRGEGKMIDYGSYVDFQGDHTYIYGRTYENVYGPEVPWPSNTRTAMHIMADYGIKDPMDEISLVLNGTLNAEEMYAAYLNTLETQTYTVVLEEGVTHVGARAFAETQVGALSLPSTLEWVGTYAFYGIGCDPLILPEGVRWLDPGAFGNGTYQSVVLPASLEVAGAYAIAAEPRNNHDLLNVTVLCADENLSSVLPGIDVTGLREGLPQFTLAQFTELRQMEALATDYYFLTYSYEMALEEIDYIAAQGLSLTEEEKDRLCDFYAQNNLFDLKEDFDADVATPEEGIAFICGMVNALLGTSLPQDGIFETDAMGTYNELYAGKIRLTPAADAAYAVKFGCSFTDTFYKAYSNYTLEQLAGGDYGYTPAPWITLRGHCGSALETTFAHGMNFEAVEHGPEYAELVPPALCVDGGVYTVICPVCGQTFTGVLSLPEHIPGDPTRENEIAPTCTAAGGYDVVIYCTVCDALLSRETITVAPLNHPNAQTAPAAAATESAHGYTAGVYCPDCDTWLSGHEVIHNHLGEQTVVKSATETEEGLVDIVCTVCGEKIRYTASVTEPKPDEDTDNGGIAGFWSRITSFFKGIIDWFLRLFRRP